MQKPTKKRSEIALAGLILGIIGLVVAFIPVINLVSILIAVVAFALGIAALFQKDVAKGNAIAAVILSLLTIVTVVAVNFALISVVGNSLDRMRGLSKNAGSNKNVKNATVKTGKFTADSGTYGLPVSITNQASKTRSFTVTIKAYDREGKYIATDSFSVSNLPAGQSKDSRLFKSVDSMTAEKMKWGNFKVESVESRD